jgi:hypothetical protein
VRRLITFVGALGIVALACEVATADPITYRLSQAGWSGGGAIAGSFSGQDINEDGVLSFRAGEVSAYSVELSGNTLIGPFVHGLEDLRFFEYRLGTQGFPPSFPLFSDDGSFFYDADDKVIGRSGFTAPFVTTAEPAFVTAVSATPEPSTLLLLGPAAAVLIRRRRERRFQHVVSRASTESRKPSVYAARA